MAVCFKLTALSQISYSIRCFSQLRPLKFNFFENYLDIFSY